MISGIFISSELMLFTWSGLILSGFISIVDSSYDLSDLIFLPTMLLTVIFPSWYSKDAAIEEILLYFSTSDDQNLLVSSLRNLVSSVRRIVSDLILTSSLTIFCDSSCYFLSNASVCLSVYQISDQIYQILDHIV